MNPRSAYLHIPFCRRRCFYCDFPVAIVGDKPPLRQVGVDRINGSNSGTITQYVEILCQEIAQHPVLGDRLDTVFFGGGTPSLLSVAQLEQLLAVLADRFGLAPDAEISMEMDPATFDLDQVQGYRSAGVTRVSLGVQAFQSELLQACGRSHRVADIEQALMWLRQAELTNISLDLISGLPTQTLAQWQESLARAIVVNPTHISCYDLIVEPGTPFSRQYQSGQQPLPSDELAAEMYRTAQQMLTIAGYEHYEVSNYARSGYHCRHNRVYWQHQPFYGFGMGATSYLQGIRFARPRTTSEYYQWVQAGQPIPQEDDRPDSAHDRLLEILMLGLRLADGIDLQWLEQEFGAAVVQQVVTCLQPYGRSGWVAGLEPQNTPNRRLRLTDPDGFLFSNTILAKLFETLEPVS